MAATLATTCRCPAPCNARRRRLVVHRTSAPEVLFLRVAVVFPGQGTQATGMGRAWRAQPSWSVVEQAEQAFGQPLAPLLLDATDEELGRTRAAQLSVLCTSLVAWDAAKDALAEHEIVAFGGHS